MVPCIIFQVTKIYLNQYNQNKNNNNDNNNNGDNNKK